MFREIFQSGFLSILYSVGNSPLQIWSTFTSNGKIRRVNTDEDIQLSVLELSGNNVATTFITCPPTASQALGIRLPYLVLLVKNMRKYFTFEVQVLDDKGKTRRFRASNFQHSTRVNPLICTMPMRLDYGWNRIQLSLSDLVKKAYGTNYVETLRVQIHANCRLRRIYFCDRLYSEAEVPQEFCLYAQPETEAINAEDPNKPAPPPKLASTEKKSTSSKPRNTFRSLQHNRADPAISPPSYISHSPI